MENIEIIRRACIVANPGIVADPEYYGKEGRTIRLADVLLALGMTWGSVVQRGDGKEPSKEWEDAGHILRLWNLRSDDLSAQSPETLSFLADLLTKTS